MIKEFVLCMCNNFTNFYFSVNGEQYIGKFDINKPVGEHIKTSANGDKYIVIYDADGKKVSETLLNEVSQEEKDISM